MVLIAGPLVSSLIQIDAVIARRRAVECQVAERWRDRVRNELEARVLTPLDAETAQIRAAIERLDTELGEALQHLNA